MVKLMMAALFASCFAVPALAGDCGDCGKSKDEGSCADRIKNADSDGDGKLSKDEFWGDDAEFAKYDADSDGFITAEEMRSADKKAGKGGAPKPAKGAAPARGGGCKGGGCGKK